MLVEIDTTDGDTLCKILEKEWPYSIHAINYMQFCLKWKKKYKQLDVSLLRSKYMESGVIIIIFRSGCFFPEITFYALDSYEEELERCLLHCPSIDWSKKFRTARISLKHRPVLDRVMREKSCEMYNPQTVVLQYMTRENALKLNTECPPDVEIRKLSSHHLDKIYETWGMNYVHNLDALRICYICADEYALGVFDKRDDVLLCNGLLSQCGAISALQTIPEAQGKGYAKLLVRKMTKKIAENSMLPYTVADDSNKASNAVFRSVGYEVICDTISSVVIPINENKSECTT